MRMRIKAGLPVIWRSPDTVQIGTTSARGSIISGLTPAEATAIKQLGQGLALDAVPPERLARLLQWLSESGVIAQSRVVGWDHRLTRLLPHLTPRERLRVTHEAQAWSVLQDGTEDSWYILARRARHRVHLLGDDPAVGVLAQLLAPAGFEAVTSGPALLPLPDPAPTAVVVVASNATDTMLGDALVRADLLHLPLVFHPNHAAIGPLVRPGVTACLRCLDLHRTATDQQWPIVAAQLLSHRPPPRPLACTWLAASIAVLHLLQALSVEIPEHDQLEPSAALQIDLPEGTTHQRSWLPHHRCTCRWLSATPPPNGPGGISQARSATITV